jgi:hypothetical protein
VQQYVDYFERQGSIADFPGKMQNAHCKSLVSHLATKIKKKCPNGVNIARKLHYCILGIRKIALKS